MAIVMSGSQNEKEDMDTTIATLNWSSLLRTDVLIIGLLVVCCHFQFASCIGRHGSGCVSHLFLVLVTDFPPNLEDGEQWLPADIYHEIVYGSFEPKALADNTGEEGATEVETFDHGGNGVLTEHYCLWPVPRHGEEPKGIAGTSGGTGVFLPRTPLMKSTEIKGTGVFLQPFASNGLVTVQKSKMSGKMFVAKKETPGKKEVSEGPAEIRLPAEWTY